MPRTKTGKQLVAQILKQELDRQLQSVLRKISHRYARVLALHLAGARNLRARQIVTPSWIQEISAMEQAKLEAALLTPEGQKRVKELTTLVIPHTQ